MPSYFEKLIADHLRFLPVVGPYKKHIRNLKPEVNLSDNLNHFLLDHYPPFESEDLKELYTRSLIKDDTSLSFLQEDGFDLFVINGALEGLNLILNTFLKEGDGVVSFEPTFPFYKDVCERQKLNFQPCPLLGTNLDLPDLKKAKTKKPHAIIFCDPNNPTSTRINPVSILDCLESFEDSLIIIDETYMDYSFFPSNLIFLKKYPNLLILRGLSKGWGMASLRMCMIFGQTQTVECLKRFCVPYPVSDLSIQQAKYRISLEEKSIKATWKKIQTERERVSMELRSISTNFFVYPSHTNFLCLNFQNEEALLSYLFSQGILVENISPLLPNCLRITIGTVPENNFLLQCIKNFIHKNPMSEHNPPLR